MRKYIIVLAMIIMGFSSHNAFAFKFTKEICQKYNLGRNWYCEEGKEEKSKAEEKREKKQRINSQDILNSSISAEEKAFLLNKLWESQRHRAVINGSKEEIIEFLETHNLIIDKGMEFAKNTTHIIEANPVFASSESFYKNIHEQNLKDKEQEDILHNSASRYGIVFVYSHNCPHCHNQLPILLRLKEIYKFRIMGIAIDTSLDPENIFDVLDENITNPEAANDPLIKAVPTILLLDKLVPSKIFIAKGLSTLTDLEEKIARRIKEHENE